jgi:hypothetical protein
VISVEERFVEQQSTRSKTEAEPPTAAASRASHYS